MDQLTNSPLSFGQEALWFIEQLSPGGSSYNVPRVYRLRGAVDLAALRAALTVVVRRHEVLRTVYRATDGVPHQVVLPAGVELPVTDLADLPAAQAAERAMREAAEEARRPFDLAAGPLFRARVVRLAEAEYLLCLTMHHICTDGWSLGVIAEELSEAYAALAAGREPALPELPVQFGDFAVWQREWLRGDALERRLGYWQERLAGVPALELPADRPRPPVPSFSAEAFTDRRDARFCARLRAFAQEHGVSLFVVLAAAVKVVLSRYSGQDDVAVGATVLGRDEPELERLVGYFTNLVVLRTDLSGDPSFVELLGRVRDVTLGAYDNEVPFEK
ncbi:condensation domain-containing protein, partial [Plantactinospora sp. B5E13]